MTLGQIQNGKKVVNACAGRRLNSAELSYSVTEKEALAVIEVIKKFQQFHLYGRRFTVHTDHHALKWLMTIKDVTGRLARWSLFIQQFDFDIKHRPGITNGNADGLSRRPYSVKNVAALDPLVSFSTDRICEMQQKDPELAQMMTYLETKKLPNDEKSSRFVLQHENFFLMIMGYYITSGPLMVGAERKQNRN